MIHGARKGNKATLHNYVEACLPENGMLLKDQRIKLALEVLKLKSKYREVIVLYYYEDLAVIEIADLLNCSENTVKTRMSSARAQLKEQIGDMEVSFYEEAIER